MQVKEYKEWNTANFEVEIQTGRTVEGLKVSE